MASSSSGQGHPGAAIGFVSIVGAPYWQGCAMIALPELYINSKERQRKNRPVESDIRAVTSFLFFLANAILVYAEPLAAGIRSVTKTRCEYRRPRISPCFFS